MDTRTGVGVAGTGFAARSHVDALRRLPGVEVVAVSSDSPERARKFAELHEIPLALGDHFELAENEDVDALHVCTRNDSHAALCVSALGSGKHVLAEKPLALTSEEGAAVLEAQRSAAEDGAVARVCFQYRHYPLVQQLRQSLARRDHGEIHFVRGGYLQDWLLHATDWNWRIDPAIGGHSRAIADIGSHWVDLVQHVTGDRIVSVLADLATTHATRGEDGSRVSVASEDFGTVLIAVWHQDRAEVSLVTETRDPSSPRISWVVARSASTETSIAGDVLDEVHPVRPDVGDRPGVPADRRVDAPVPVGRVEQPVLR